MKVLYLDHPEADFLATILYMGLCEELGTDNVVDYPYKRSYHGESHTYPREWVGGQVGTTGPFPWMNATTAREWSRDEVLSRLGEFDLAVLASPRHRNAAVLSDIIAAVGRGRLPRFVMVDGEDYTAIRWDLAEQFGPSVYFKLSMVTSPQEMYHDAKVRMSRRVRVVPFPLASPLRDVLPRAKDLDVAFLGGGSWRVGRGDRVNLQNRLTAEFPGRVAVGNMGYAEYIDTLSRSKIAVCVGGHGLEPLRTFEFLSCPGTMLAREQIDVITPYPFVDGATCALWSGDDIDGLFRMLHHYLNNEPERHRVAASGNEYVRTHFTPRARAKQLLEEAFR